MSILNLFMQNKKSSLVVIRLLVLLSLINLISYYIAGETTNYFQDFLASKKDSSKVFTFENQVSLVIMTLIFIINLHPKLENQNYQKYLLLALSAINLVFEVSLKFFPFILGFNYALFFLTNGWIQIFCPPSLRGTVSGILTAANGVLDFLDTYIENDWVFDVVSEHITGFLMFVCVGVVFFILQKVPKHFQHLNNTQQYLRLNVLCRDYLFIFLSCILVGLNSGIFYYTYNIALIVLPGRDPAIFQYMVNLISIVAPFIFGFIADKYGYMRTQMKVFYAITLCHLLNFIVNSSGFKTDMLLYGLSFIDCVLANCLNVSIFAICGYYFFKQGIFRSFALNGILYNVGNGLCDILFSRFYQSYANYQLALTFCNIIFLYFIIQSFKKFHLHHQLL